MADSLGYIVSAIVTGLFGIIIVIMQIKGTRATKSVHEEVRTNHGVRQGQRIEDLGADLLDLKNYVTRKMVTKDELQAHADNDVLVAKELTAANLETRSIILAAIRVQGDTK